MVSCQCAGIEDYFDAREAASDLDRYRRDGPDPTTRVLLDALKEEGVEGMSLLDIGGGVGVIQHELLKAGASRATNVEASSAYAEAAKKEAERLGYGDRIRTRHGNFVDLAPEIPETEIITLDRVICCFDDMRSLVSMSAARALKLYGVVYPRDDWWVKPVMGIENLIHRLRRRQFRVYVHPTAEVDRRIRNAGLRPVFHHRTIAWQVIVYRR